MTRSERLVRSDAHRSRSTMIRMGRAPHELRVPVELPAEAVNLEGRSAEELADDAPALVGVGEVAP